MAGILADLEISNLVREVKKLPYDYRSKIEVRSKRGHKERELDLKGENGNDFRLIFRQGVINPIDFSVILVYRPPTSNLIFPLRRYNGKSHEHTNTLEGNTFYDFHIHQATQRYQDIGGREDAFAEPTDRFADFQQAIACLFNDCAFELPYDPKEDFSRRSKK